MIGVSSYEGGGGFAAATNDWPGFRHLAREVGPRQLLFAY